MSTKGTSFNCPNTNEICDFWAIPPFVLGWGDILLTWRLLRYKHNTAFLFYWGFITIFSYQQKVIRSCIRELTLAKADIFITGMCVCVCHRERKRQKATERDMVVKCVTSSLLTFQSLGNEFKWYFNAIEALSPLLLIFFKSYTFAILSQKSLIPWRGEKEKKRHFGMVYSRNSKNMMVHHSLYFINHMFCFLSRGDKTEITSGRLLLPWIFFKSLS